MPEPLTIPSPSGPIEILRAAIRAVPAIKYALGVAGIAATVAIVAGFTIGYKVAFLGTVIMLGFMFCLVLFSSFAQYGAASTRPLALTLAWTFVLLTSMSGLFIVTGFFFSWPKPLEAYVQSPTPTPAPTSLVTPTLTPPATPPATPTVAPSATPAVTSALPPIQVGQAKISITHVPPYDPVGGRKRTEYIVGSVSGVASQNYRVVIYSLTNVWYLQPSTDEPLTEIAPDGKWSAEIHTGTKYAALLVQLGYNPPATTANQPSRLVGVVAATEMDGRR